MSLEIEGLLRVLRGRDMDYSVRHPDYSYLDEFCCCEERHCHLPGETPKERHHYATLMIAAPEMYESLRDAILFMQFLGKKDRPLSAEEQEWLNKAVLVLAKIEGGGE